MLQDLLSSKSFHWHGPPPWDPISASCQVLPAAQYLQMLLEFFSYNKQTRTLSYEVALNTTVFSFQGLNFLLAQFFFFHFVNYKPKSMSSYENSRGDQDSQMIHPNVQIFLSVSYQIMFIA